MTFKTTLLIALVGASAALTLKPMYYQSRATNYQNDDENYFNTLKQLHQRPPEAPPNAQESNGYEEKKIIQSPVTRVLGPCEKYILSTWIDREDGTQSMRMPYRCCTHWYLFPSLPLLCCGFVFDRLLGTTRQSIKDSENQENSDDEA
jgi:hypothetical protein